MKNHLLAGLLAIAGCIATQGAIAQEFKQPIRFIVPYGAGGATDVLARLVSIRIAKELGQPVIVENKPGAGGQIGAQALKGLPRMVARSW